MCGIVAAAGKPLERAAFQKAINQIRHRGPDANGYYKSASEEVWLGHRRLSIVDLSPSGQQPMHNEDQTIWLICNGEIYNYFSLRPRLEKLGHVFYSNSDNEVILHAYETWGEKFFDELEGMFSFVLWDETKQQLIAARDRVGIKPLYYSFKGQHLLVASEASAMLPLFENRPAISPMALAYLLSMGYIPAPYSIWSGIHKLEPGNYITWQRTQGIKEKSYWEPPHQLVQEQDNEQAWSALFDLVVKEHLLADVPIGLFLSGGIDSSAIAACLKSLDIKMRALTVQLKGSPRDESPIARKVTRHLRIPHKIFPISVRDVNKLLYKTMSAFDEPQGYGALLTMYLISQKATRRYKVVLAGDGGDEIFGGYRWYQNLALNPLDKSRELLSPDANIEQQKNVIEQFVQSSVLHRHAWRVFPRFLPEEIQYLLSPLSIEFGDEEALAPFRKYYHSDLPLQRALQRVDLMTFCSGSILAKVDRASMAHSLEVRVPFLDRRMVEWGLTRPLDSREPQHSKPVLRDYLENKVPSSVLSHPKQGFSLGVMQNYNWDDAVDRIQASKFAKSGFMVENWEKLLITGTANRQGRIWALLSLSQWVENWL